MNLFKKLSIVFLIAFTFNCKKDEIVPPNFINYEENQLELKREIVAKIYNDNSITLENRNLFIYIENFSIDSFSLKQSSFSHAEYSADSSTISQKYFTNTSENSDGYIKVTNINKNNLTISGEFAFKGLNDSDQIQILNGSFENIHLEKEEGIYLDGKASSIIDGKSIKFAEVLRLETADPVSYLSFTLIHPNHMQISIQMPKNINIGINQITSNNIFDTEEISFDYLPNYGENGVLFFYSTPLGICTLEINEFNLETRVIKGNLKGKFSRNSGEIVNIEKLELDLNWRDR